MRRTSPLTILLVLFALGLVATVVADQYFERRFERATQVDAERASQQSAEELLAVLEDQIATSSVLVDLVASNQWTLQEFQASWSNTFIPSFPGESNAAVYALVEPAELDGFFEAMQRLAPGYTPSFINDDPPDIGHIITVFQAVDTGYMGSDLTSIPGIVEQFQYVPVDGVTINQASFQGAPGDIRTVHNHRLLAADGVDRQAWTVFSLDWRIPSQAVLDGLGSQYGASVSVERTGYDGAYSIGNIGDYGIDRETAAATDTASAQGDVLTVTIDAWTDGSETSGPSSTVVWAVGMLATLAAAALAALAMLLATLLERIRTSDRDARSDPLTALHNRRWLLEQLADRTSNVAVLFCDLDRFKVVNDSAGHTAGDQLLIDVGQRFIAAIEGQGQVARWGGDEFVAFCETSADPEAAGVDLAKQLTAALENPFDVAGGTVRVSASIGIATAIAGDTMTPEELMRGADVALGRCKAAPNTDYRVYNESLKDAELDQLQLESDLQIALDRGDLTVHFQPVVDTAGVAVSYEALVRWQRNGELMAPYSFLPLAAEMGRSPDLDRIVLDKSLSILASAQRAGQPAMTLHVNTDAASLEDPDFPPLVKHLLDHHNVLPEHLTLELTEGEWVDAMDSIAPVLRALNALGVGLAIDDFGSGYSSLARMLKIPGLTELKIDRSMTESIVDDDTRVFLTGLIDGVHQLGLTVVSEGVETEEQFGLLREMGVTRFQGYLFAKPGPAEAVGLATDRSAGIAEVSSAFA